VIGARLGDAEQAWQMISYRKLLFGRLRHRGPGRGIKVLSGTLCLIAAAALGPSWAARSEPALSVTLGAYEMPPLIGQDLPFGGTMTHIVRESFKLGGVEVKIVFLPNNRAITGVMKGLYDGTYGWAYTKERDQYLLYSHNAIRQSRNVFFQRAGEIYQWRSVKDLIGYKIGDTLGDFYSDDFTAFRELAGVRVEEAGSDLANMKKLLSGHIDLFPMEEEVGQYLILHNFSPKEQQGVVAQTQVVATFPVYVVINRTLPNAAELVERFDRGYQWLKESGALARITEEAEEAARTK
jgi:polar amino acid transport system substrate-binding protein